MEELTTTQAAELLGVSRQYLPKLIKSGQLAARRVGRDWIIRRSDLERFRKGGRRKPGRPPTIAKKRKGS